MAQHSAIGPVLQSLKNALGTKHLSGTTESVDAVVGLLLVPAKSDLELLLIHRAERINDPWSGQIGLPGGGVERSDRSARDALKREVMEEVGVDLTHNGEELGTLSIGSPMRRLDMKVQPWVFGLNTRPTVQIGSEVQEAFWVPVAKLPSLRSHGEIEIRGIRREVDAFLVDGRVVWGYTHRVLNEMLSILDLDG